MKKIVIAALLLGGHPLLYSASIACAVNGFPQGSGHAPVGKKIPCSQAPFTIMANFPKVAISGNTLTITPQFSISTTDQTITKQYFATISFDRGINIPNSPGTDVLKVTASYGADFYTANPGFYATFLAEIGPGSPGSPEVILNPATETCEFGTCLYSATLPADAFSFLIVQGTAGLVALPAQLNGGVETGADITVSRFKADGVTPDPFPAAAVPESADSTAVNP